MLFHLLYHYKPVVSVTVKCYFFLQVEYLHSDPLPLRGQGQVSFPGAAASSVDGICTDCNRFTVTVNVHDGSMFGKIIYIFIYIYTPYIYIYNIYIYHIYIYISYI